MRDARSHWVETDGVRLHVEIHGDGPDLVLLHGFTGSTASMRDVATALAGRYRTLSIDLVGHGRSDIPENPELYSMPRCVHQVAAVLDALVSRRAHVLGYSMGGRVAIGLCAARPERVASLLVVGASAGIADAAARAERRRLDEALADRIEGGGVAAFVDEWMAQPIFETQRLRLPAWKLAAARAQRLENRAAGLVNSLRGMGTGVQAPLHDLLAETRTPVCFAVGEDDAKFRATALDLIGRIRGARIEEISAAGHAAHLENPAEFLRVAHRFFEAVEADTTRAALRPDIACQTREVTT